MDKRPLLNKEISINDFKNFYWLKEELIEFCRKEGLRSQGGKLELAGRIEEILKMGKIKVLDKVEKSKAVSGFDWKKEKLTPDTIITDNYTNTVNARTFFKE